METPARPPTVVRMSETPPQLKEVIAAWDSLPPVVRFWIGQLLGERFVRTVKINEAMLLDVTLRSARGQVKHYPEVRVGDSVSQRR